MLEEHEMTCLRSSGLSREWIATKVALVVDIEVGHVRPSSPSSALLPKLLHPSADFDCAAFMSSTRAKDECRLFDFFYFFS